MKCRTGDFDNPTDIKFCEECGAKPEVTDSSSDHPPKPTVNFMDPQYLRTQGARGVGQAVEKPSVLKELLP